MEFIDADADRIFSAIDSSFNDDSITISVELCLRTKADRIIT